jgi:hypothetical protein
MTTVTKAPLRRVITWHEDIGAAWWLRVRVRLECGHEMGTAGRRVRPMRVRCGQCLTGPCRYCGKSRHLHSLSQPDSPGGLRFFMCNTGDTAFQLAET